MNKKIYPRSPNFWDGSVPLTPERAKTLTLNDTLYHVLRTNADGTPERWRVNGKPKVWKTRPNDVQVPIKNGLYRYGYAVNFEDGYSNLSNFAVLKERE